MFRKLIFSLLIVLMIALPVQADGGPFPEAPQSAQMLYNEMQAVYLGNLARRANGVAPLRMNAQLTEASRWFSWDSVENQPANFCGHTDSQGNDAGTRAFAAGWLGFLAAENAACAYVSPQDAINGWMASQGHRENLLNPGYREIGLGYYLRASDNRGYVTQDFGIDGVYAPVIIDNEALTTSNRSVDLYIYDMEAGGGFAGRGTTQQMMVSNNACFLGADWQPYDVETPWQINNAPGWQSVYVKSRDYLGRTFSASDSIYLGSSVAPDQLTQSALSSTSPTVTMYQLDNDSLPYMQFSLGWVADDSFATFNKWWGNGESVNDTQALGGTAYRMFPGDDETFAWVWSSEFIPNQDLVAYFRLKVNNNSDPNEVARISVVGAAGEYPAVTLRGSDFDAANTYQEFAFPFTSPAAGEMMFFKLWRTGSADVTFDAVTLFTPPVPVEDTYTWNIPGGNYRGQGVWLRYTDNAGTFSGYSEAKTVPVYTETSVTQQIIWARPTDGSITRTFRVVVGCGGELIPLDDAEWLNSSIEGDQVSISVNPDGMALGVYQAQLTLQPAAPELPALTIPVLLRVVEDYSTIALPAVMR